jgi:hypothetical protein
MNSSDGEPVIRIEENPAVRIEEDGIIEGMVPELGSPTTFTPIDLQAVREIVYKMDISDKSKEDLFIIYYNDLSRHYQSLGGVFPRNAIVSSEEGKLVKDKMSTFSYIDPKTFIKKVESFKIVNIRGNQIDVKRMIRSKGGRKTRDKKSKKNKTRKHRKSRSRR